MKLMPNFVGRMAMPRFRCACAWLNFATSANRLSKSDVSRTRSKQRGTRHAAVLMGWRKCVSSDSA